MSDNGGFVIEGDMIPAFALIQWRSALGMELRSTSGMIASRHVNAKTIIPQLVAMGITDVDTTRLTRKKKIKAYDDMNTFMVANGFEDRPLDEAVRNR